MIRMLERHGRWLRLAVLVVGLGLAPRAQATTGESESAWRHGSVGGGVVQSLPLSGAWPSVWTLAFEFGWPRADWRYFQIQPLLRLNGIYAGSDTDWATRLGLRLGARFAAGSFAPGRSSTFVYVMPTFQMDWLGRGPEPRTKEFQHGLTAELGVGGGWSRGQVELVIALGQLTVDPKSGMTRVAFQPGLLLKKPF